MTFITPIRPDTLSIVSLRVVRRYLTLPLSNNGFDFFLPPSIVGSSSRDVGQIHGIIPSRSITTITNSLSSGIDDTKYPVHSVADLLLLGEVNIRPLHIGVPHQCIHRINLLLLFGGGVPLLFSTRHFFFADDNSLFTGGVRTKFIEKPSSFWMYMEVISNCNNLSW